jgi:rubrerythrin
MDIYLKEYNSVFKDVDSIESAIRLAVYDKTNIFKNRMQVFGEHNFQDKEDVTGKYEEFDSNKWYGARCSKCGWEGSSEKLGGGYPIADTGDYADVCCPVCNSYEIDDSDRYPTAYGGVMAIPLITITNSISNEDF